MLNHLQECKKKETKNTMAKHKDNVDVTQSDEQCLKETNNHTNRRLWPICYQGILVSNKDFTQKILGNCAI